MIDFLKTIPRTPLSSPLITQLCKCGTSVGANFCEADDAESPRDFKHKIGICRKESRECKHFLRMVTRVYPQKREEAATLWHEAHEVNLIFSSIRRKVDRTIAK